MVLTKKAAANAEKTSKKSEVEVVANSSESRRKSPSRAKPGRPRSPARNKSPTRAKSPGRPKSPARSKIVAENPKPGRKSVDLVKSASKTAKKSGHLTPTRRSPIRSTASKKEKDSAIPVISKKPLVTLDSDSDTADEKIEVKEKPRAAVTGRTRVDLIEKVEYKKEPSVESSSSFLSKRFTRSQTKDFERIVHLKHFEATTTKKLSEFSDEDELVKDTSTPSPFKSKKSYDYGGPIGVAFLMILFPLLGLFLYVSCDKRSCTLSQMPDYKSKFASLSQFFNLKASLGYLAYSIFVSLVCALPFGGHKITGLPGKNGKLVYVTNGLLTAILTIAIIIGLEFKQVPICKFILDNQLQLFVASFLVGVALSLIAYVRSFYVPISALNPHIIGKNKLYNFFMGRELHPRILNILDLKMFVFRLLIVSELVITFAWIFTNFQATEKIPEGDFLKRLSHLSFAFKVFSSMQLLRILDALCFEYTFITSREIQQEGFGYGMAVSYLIYPIVTATTVRYIVEHNVQVAGWQLLMMCGFFLMGLALSRLSDMQKDAFRKNPYNPEFSNLETIPTNQGKKLLASGLWGFVRHPNYLGTIMVELSFVPFVLCVPPVILRYLFVIALVHRARRDNDHCKNKYGIAWDRYCNKVRYLLVPKVY